MGYLHKQKGKNNFMAIKVDLIKAIDRIEWSLLSTILINFGYCKKFVDWIMQCISNASIAFLINGAHYDFL